MLERCLSAIRSSQRTRKTWCSRSEEGEDSNALIVRFYEWAGKSGDIRLRVPKGATAAELTNLLEEPEGSPLPIEEGDSINVPRIHSKSSR